VIDVRRSVLLATGQHDLEEDQLGLEALREVGGPPDRLVRALALVGGDEDLADQR
jgi:hypothetical protein